MNALDAGALVRLLADPDRRRVVAALVLGAVTIDDVTSATALPVREVVEALSRLEAAGLVERGGDGTVVLLEQAFALAARATAPEPRASEHADEPADVARILDQAFRDGRLVQLPTKESKRLVVLDHIAQRFEPGQRYTEKQVNASLSQVHEDTATLRRDMVDFGFMDRADGEYWRSGGTV
ncbi:MAG: DUF2087 domain-containing protein [Actinomycetota bacterium]